MAFLTEIEFWQWWAAGLVFLGLEIVVPGTFFLFLAVGTGVTGLVMLATPDIGWEAQLLIFAGSSLVSAVAFRFWQSKRPTQSDDTTLNRRGAQYIGRIATVAETMRNGHGRLSIGDSSWACESTDGSDFVAGAKVEITEVRGATMVVKAAP